MKYLIINGSPHKGNTWKLVEIARTALSERDGAAEFEEIHLANHNLPFCIGCSNCFRLGYEKCPHYEPLSAVIHGIENADGVIVASTTFNLRETALLKNLFDHLCHMLHRPHFFHSKALVITTTGGVGARSAAKSIAAMLKGIGFNRCYRFGVTAFSWNAYEPKPQTVQALTRITDQFYRDVSSGKLHSPSASLLIPYNLFRGMSLAYTKDSEFATEDGRFWTREDRKSGVYDASVPVSLYIRPIGHLFYWIGKMAGKLASTQVSYKK